MKRVLSCLIVLTVLFFCLPVHAQTENAYLCTLYEEDMKNDSLQLYLTRCHGHYDSATDSATLYIANTSEIAADFDVRIGWEGHEPVTFVQTGYVTLEPGQIGKFVLTGLRDFPEKSNDELGYVPGSHLGETSVVRINVKGLPAGSSFVIAGINGYKEVRNTSFTVASDSALTPAGEFLVDNALLVIPEEETAEETGKITLEVPETGKVQSFLSFALSSAILCAGGLILFTVRYFIREKKHD